MDVDKSEFDDDCKVEASPFHGEGPGTGLDWGNSSGEEEQDNNDGNNDDEDLMDIGEL